MFTDGITNKLVGCFHHPTATKNGGGGGKLIQSSEENVHDDVVLVRVYGNKTDLLIDRKAETRNIKLLQSYGFAPNLFATFKNGLAYEYVPGVTLTSDTIVKPKVWRLIARRMAEMHKIDCGFEYVKEPSLCSKMNQFFDLIPEKFTDENIHER